MPSTYEVHGGVSFGPIYIQTTCLYNATSGQAYQSQACHWEICCLASQIPVQWVSFGAGRCPAKLSMWFDDCLLNKIETPSVNTIKQTNKNPPIRCEIHQFSEETMPTHVEHVRSSHSTAVTGDISPTWLDSERSSLRRGSGLLAQSVSCFLLKKNLQSSLRGFNMMGPSLEWMW